MYIPIYAMTFIEEKVQFWEKRPPYKKNSGYGPDNDIPNDAVGTLLRLPMPKHTIN